MRGVNTTTMIKKLIFCMFYHNLVGCVRDTNWTFHLDSLYPEGRLPLEDLGIPFTCSEIQNAIRYTHSNASPGPDGFGPSFFKATWNITSPVSLIFSMPSMFMLQTLNASTALTLFSLPKRTMHVTLGISGL